MIDAADGPLLATFSAVVRCGGFSRAAADLKLSKSVVSERVRELERRCGVTLLERTTRRIRLTDAGSEVLNAAAQVQDTLARLRLQLDGFQRQPSGTLRISTTDDLGPALVAPAVARFLASYPKVRVEILAEDTQRDMLDAHIDLAVRLGAPKSSSFYSQKLAELKEPIVAAPALASHLGVIKRPRDLAEAAWVRHSLLPHGPLRFIGPRGAEETITPRVRAEANTGTTLLGLLISGAGVGVLPEHALREHLHQGRLVHLCPGWIWKTITLFALTPSKPSGNATVEAFLQLLRETMALDTTRWAYP